MLSQGTVIYSVIRTQVILVIWHWEIFDDSDKNDLSRGSYRTRYSGELRK